MRSRARSDLCRACRFARRRRGRRRVRPPTGGMMLVSSAWLTVWHSRFCVALCCTGLHRWLWGEILANLTIKAQRLDNKLPGDGGTGACTIARFLQIRVTYVASVALDRNSPAKGRSLRPRRSGYHGRSAVLADELAVRVCFQEDPDRTQRVTAGWEHSGRGPRIYK